MQSSEAAKVARSGEQTMVNERRSSTSESGTSKVSGDDDL
jgi:hypothetical protein